MERSTLLTLSLAMAVLVRGQSPLTTYYIVPPNAGCDGLWAFGPYSTMWAACGTAPYQWMFNPTSCNTPEGTNMPLTVVNDTIMVQLCSLPCSFQLYSGEVGLCFVELCELPADPTGLPRKGLPAARSIAPNPVPSYAPYLVIEPPSEGNMHVSILDMTGRAHRHQTLQPGDMRLDLGTIPQGGYMLLIRDERGLLTLHRFTVE